MVSSWMVTRFRSSWISQNLALLVLRLLSESTRSEWELLSSIHAKYGVAPSARELGTLERELLRDGYAALEPGAGGRLSVTHRGLRLLGRLEEEHLALVADTIRSGRDVL